jgi:hypothetical protein
MDASFALFDAGIDGAGPVVAAGRSLAAPATERGIADLDAVAKQAVLAARIVRHILAATQCEVASVERAFDPVVALPVLEARAPEGDTAIVDGIVDDVVAPSVAWPRVDDKGAAGRRVRAPRQAKDDPDRAAPHADPSVAQVPQKALWRGS